MDEILVATVLLASFTVIRFLGRYLAEDQVCGEEIAAKGLRVVVARAVIEWPHSGRSPASATRSDGAVVHFASARVRCSSPTRPNIPTGS